ncbi:hypothetical protein G6M89_06410 [Natronolimnobius sp. AArcel1]|uniref:hypothetical protein n=1 Tax=Natronolimnobius sp. AArcel1 TaxID=1679093 RepID=UPI0013EB02EB|nr:hypothetical protein [Natronolimnobius sp. AArcel1]NGM68644.1 hypothetical protein [Natronolimnobius sp. AArcel1]
MPSNPRPIPPEALPPGWGAAELCEGRFRYRYSRPPIELVADRTTADRCHPGLGLNYYWELRYRYSIGEQLHTATIGRVSTRGAALEGLLECMHRVHDKADVLEDPFDVSAVVKRVSLSDFIPGTDTAAETK